MNQAVDALTQKQQRSPTIPEIAEYLDVTPDEVLEALETSEAYNFVSLESDRNTDGSDSFSILEYIGKDDHLMAVVDDRTTLAAALKDLTPAGAARPVPALLRGPHADRDRQAAVHLADAGLAPAAQDA